MEYAVRVYVLTPPGEDPAAALRAVRQSTKPGSGDRDRGHQFYDSQFHYV
jgi:hypothetical protein